MSIKKPCTKTAAWGPGEAVLLKIKKIGPVAGPVRFAGIRLSLCVRTSSPQKARRIVR